MSELAGKKIYCAVSKEDKYLLMSHERKAVSTDGFITGQVYFISSTCASIVKWSAKRQEVENERN